MSERFAYRFSGQSVCSSGQCPRESSCRFLSSVGIAATRLLTVCFTYFLSLLKKFLHARIIRKHSDGASPVFRALHLFQCRLQRSNFCFQGCDTFFNCKLHHNSSPHYPFVTVSSKFRITLATMLQAASSGTS